MPKITEFDRNKILLMCQVIPKELLAENYLSTESSLSLRNMKTLDKWSTKIKVEGQKKLSAAVNSIWKSCP